MLNPQSRRDLKEVSETPLLEGPVPQTNFSRRLGPDPSELQVRTRREDGRGDGSGVGSVVAVSGLDTVVGEMSKGVSDKSWTVDLLRRLVRRRT